mgnify:CR=1 FL=1
MGKDLGEEKTFNYLVISSLAFMLKGFLLLVFPYLLNSNLVAKVFLKISTQLCFLDENLFEN